MDAVFRLANRISVLVMAASSPAERLSIRADEQ